MHKIISIGLFLFILGNATAITGNPVKFLMGLTSIGFDLIFILQHYWLYPAPHTTYFEGEVILENEETPLIQNSNIIDC